MTRKRNDRNRELALPPDWEVGTDYDGKVFYINHTLKQTTWIDPRDRFTKPATFADCVGDELPYGWEQSYNSVVGMYYINHLTQTNQLEDPRLQWREEQERMLKEYLTHAHEDLASKQEIYCVKQERLALAQEEVHHLSTTLERHWKASRTSLNSTSSACSTKYDPDLLKADVALARTRVARLKRELEQIRTEMKYQEQGVKTLAEVDQKMAEQGSMYSVEQAEDILNRIHSIRKSLIIGKQEKYELMQSLARLKDDVLANKVPEGSSSPDVSTLSLPPFERLNTASQTDLSGEYAAHDHRWGEIVRMRLQYDEARKQVSQMQEELAAIENQMIPGQNESDKERLLLIQEKDQLLRELRSISPKGRAEEEMEDIRARCQQLEYDLAQAVQVSNQQIAERLKLNEAKSDVVKRLKEATQLTTHLESHLKSLSQSTLSMSSGSSRGSLGSLSASSKGSLSSLNYSDIYSQKSTSPDVSLTELHHRVEKLLQGHTTCISPIREIVSGGSTENIAAEMHGTHPGEYRMSPGSSVSSISSQLSSLSLYEAGPPPSYEQHLERQRHNGCAESSAVGCLHPELNVPAMVRSANGGCLPVYVSPSKYLLSHGAITEQSPENSVSCMLGSGMMRRSPYASDLISSSDLAANPPLSPISESSSGVCNNLSGGNTRSVSAAVSDESVAGDSGVYEAAIKRSGALDESLEMALECAQVQIKLKYEGLNSELHIGIEQARNLAALAFTEDSQVCIKAALLPSRSYMSFCTPRSHDLRHPKFNQTFCVSIAECKLESKTLQVHIWSVNETDEEECLGCAQVSLASFHPRHISIEWYNVLSFKFMQSESSASSGNAATTSASVSSTTAADQVEQLLQASSRQLRQVSHKSDKQSVSDGSVRVSRDEPNGSGRESRESMATLSCHSCVASGQKEESSDESTIISSRTSTLTRSQGADDMDRHEGLGSQLGAESGEEEEEEEERDTYIESNELVIREPHDLLRVDEGSNEDDDESEVATCDAETNTECSCSHGGRDNLKRHGHKSARASSIRRSQTFSPLGRHSCDYICKLNRSDSDSSVKYRRGPFQRSAIERRSLRFKKLSTSRSLTPADCSSVTRTSIDLELDFQASQTRLSQLNDEIARLKDLKRRFEEMKAKGDGEPPEWFTENEKLQHFLTEADKLLARHEKRNRLSRVDEKAEKYLRKVMREVKQLPRREDDQPEVLSFRRKMAFFTSVNMTVPVIVSESESETDDADETMKFNCQSLPVTTTVATPTAAKTSVNKHSSSSSLPNTKV